MEIKKLLAKAGKRLTPQIEASNTAVELRQLATRFIELLDYAEAKETRRTESKKEGGGTAAQRARQRILDDQAKGRAIQDAEHRERMDDQQQHLAQGGDNRTAEEIVEAEEDEDAGREPTEAK